MFSQLTVLDNVLAGLTVKARAGILANAADTPFARREARRFHDAAEDVIAFLEIEAYRDVPVGRLPYGLQKRVELARALVAKLGAGVACSTGEVAELVAAAQSVHWASAEHLRAVESAAVAVATTLAAGRSHRRPMQNFESLPSYGTRAMWDRMLAGDRDALLQHAARLGLRCPSEPTMQRLAAVSLIASEGPEKAMATSTAVRQAYFRSLKRAFKAYAIGEPTVYVVSLPDSPRLLRSLHRELYDAVYAAEGPVECPFAADCIHGVSVFKMRGAAAAPPPAYSEGAQQMGCWAQALMQGFQMMLSGATPLLVNQRGQPVILATPPSQGLRAILDAPPHQAPTERRR